MEAASDIFVASKPGQDISQSICFCYCHFFHGYYREQHFSEERLKVYVFNQSFMVVTSLLECFLNKPKCIKNLLPVTSTGLV